MFYNLKRVREDNELTQREMAKVLEISKSSYNYFETGEQIIPLKHLNNFCNIFHVTMDYLANLTSINSYTKQNSTLDAKLIGSRIKQIRKKNNLTQEQLAKVLNTSQSNISSYESGKNLIITAFLYDLAKEFNVSLDYLAGRSDTIKILKRKD